MNAQRKQFTAMDLSMLDRQVIRVDMPPEHAGITAALRRAFADAATDPAGRDFADLLRKLS